MQKALDTRDDDRLYPLGSLNKNEWERLHLHHGMCFVVNAVAVLLVGQTQ